MLNRLGIKTLDRKFYQVEATGQAYLIVKLKVKKLDIGEHEQLGSLLPKDIMYYFYSSKMEDWLFVKATEQVDVGYDHNTEGDLCL